MTGWTHEFSFPMPVPATPERLFTALTSAAELEQWFAEHARVEPRAGGAYAFWGRHTVGTPTEHDAAGRLTAFEPNTRLAFDWKVYGVPSSVTITLAPAQTEQGPATTVAIRHELSGPLDQPRPRELIDDWWRFTLGNLMLHTTGLGRVLRPDFADPRPEIRMDMHVDAPPQAVFKALIEPDALRKWMGAPAPVVEPRVGGRYELGWTYPVDGREVTGGPMRIIDIVTNQRLVLSWPDWRGDRAVPMQSITWQLEPKGAGTQVTVVHAGFVRTVDLSDYPFGWGHFMTELATVAMSYKESR